MRFPEFKESWVKFKLKDYFEFKNGLNKEKEAFGQGVKIINYMDVNKNRYLYSNNIKGLVNLSKNEVNSFQVMRGDLFFTRTSETSEEIGLTAVLLDNPPVMVFSGFLLRARPNNECLLLPEFCSYSFSNNRIRYEIIKKSSITTRALTSGTLLNEVINYHPIEQEQMKIAKLFFALDKRIETQSKIIKDLEILIKGIRYRIFSDNYNYLSNVKNACLKNYLVEYSQKNSNNNLRLASIGKYGIRMRNEIYSKELSNDYSKNKVIFKDTLSIGMGSSQIDIGILSKDEQYCISPAYTTYKIVDINSDYLNEYLIYLNPLLSKKYMITGVRQGKSVNKTELLNHVIKVHSKVEQQKITKILTSLFNKLNNEKNILELYKKQKAYLLQNMFI